MGSSLEVEGLSWSFAEAASPFIEIPSLSVGAGSVVALVGPSGAGKSTLLALLSGLEEVRRGSIRWDGRDLASMADRERCAWRAGSLGFVFQDFQLVPELSALENVLLPVTFGRWRVPSRERSRAQELLSRMGVERVRARANTLSRGEMQRVSVARALLGNPGIILADEPTASLDARSEGEVASLLLEAARMRGATLIVSTHHRALVDRADRVVELAHGAIAGEAGGTAR